MPGRLLDDPLTLPMPELTFPDPRLVTPWLDNRRRLRVDVSESGLISVASAGEAGGFEPLLDFGPGTDVTFGSWQPPLAASVELGPSGLRASAEHDRETTFGASGYALLPWQVWLTGHSWFRLDLNGNPLRFEPGLELSPRIAWGGLSLETAALRSEWVAEEGLQVCSPGDSVRIGYALAGALAALEVRGRLDLEMAELAFERADWRGELDLGLARTGACLIRPQASLALFEQERQLESSLRLGLRSDLLPGQLVDLMLEYPRLEMSELSLDSIVLPEQRLVLRLVF